MGGREREPQRPELDQARAGPPEGGATRLSHGQHGKTAFGRATIDGPGRPPPEPTADENAAGEKTP